MKKLILLILLVGCSSVTPVETVPEKVGRYEAVAQYLTTTPTATASFTPTRPPTRTPTRTQTPTVPKPIFNPAQSIDARQRVEQTKWIADIISIDYLARTIAVNISGASGPRVLAIPINLDLGTVSAPKFFVGNQAIVERINDRYVVRDILVSPGKSIGTSGGISTLRAPTNLSVIIQGTSLIAKWDAVDGAIGYELFQSSTTGPGGIIYPAIYRGTATSYSNAQYLPPVTTNLLTNPGFELGLDGSWNTNPPGEWDSGANNLNDSPITA